MHIKIYDSDSQIASMVKKKGKEKNPSYSLNFWLQDASNSNKDIIFLIICSMQGKMNPQLSTWVLPYNVFYWYGFL